LERLKNVNDVPWRPEKPYGSDGECIDGMGTRAELEATKAVGKESCRILDCHSSGISSFLENRCPRSTNYHVNLSPH
jgi:hypothetical protein